MVGVSGGSRLEGGERKVSRRSYKSGRAPNLGLYRLVILAPYDTDESGALGVPVSLCSPPFRGDGQEPLAAASLDPLRRTRRYMARAYDRDGEKSTERERRERETEWEKEREQAKKGDARTGERLTWRQEERRGIHMCYTVGYRSLRTSAEFASISRREKKDFD